MQQLGLSTADFAPASADASFRRYFRLTAADGRSWVIMDAPPDKEDCAPFIHVAGLMAEAGVHAPQVLAQSSAGYLLLSDLGRQTYLHVLNENNAAALFSAAIDALIRWQRASRAGALPPYDEALLRRELGLFPEWYVGRHLGRSFSAAQQRVWDALCAQLVASALAQPTVWVHRDYMPRNLMISDINPGVLDFQDAVMGPITYDLLSLFKDAFLSWPQSRIDVWVDEYRSKARAAGLPVDPDPQSFARSLDLMGLQRHLKVLGIFARICHRDGKPHYLEDAPRFIRYVRDEAARWSDMQPLLGLFDELGLVAP